MTNDDPGGWAKLCRTQAALTSDPAARELLLQLATEYEAIRPGPLARVADDVLQDEIVKSVKVAAERER